MVNRKQFFELLAAAFNISPVAEPGDEVGETLNRAALNFAVRVYNCAERGKPGAIEGVLLAMRLFIELEDNPQEGYVEQQIRDGWSGDRCGWSRAGDGYS